MQKATQFFFLASIPFGRGKDVVVYQPLGGTGVADRVAVGHSIVVVWRLVVHDVVP
jgi:hypothetical protein